MDMSKITAFLLLMAASVTFPRPAGAARFQILHGTVDGGGGTSIARRFSVETSISPFSSAGHAPLLNDPPSPQKDFLQVPSTGSIAIPIAELLANDSDLEGNRPKLALFQTNTLRGGVVALTNEIISYTPPAVPHPHGDSFSYVLSDSLGASSFSKVVLFSPAAAPRLAGVRQSETNLQITFQPYPNASYLLQARSAFGLNQYWSDYPSADQPLIQQAVSGEFIEFVVPIEASHRFFRAVDIETLQSELTAEKVEDRLTFTRRGIPRGVYKLQFRTDLQPNQPWSDYPSAARPFITRSAPDGIYQISVPILNSNGFFRTVPNEH